MQKLFDTIQSNLDAAQAHLAAVRAEMARLEEAGMYPVVPTEQWQTRNGTDTRYLYMLFRQGPDGEYQGSDGKRKLYVGCKAERIAEARRLAGNRQRYVALKKAADQLDGWLAFKKHELERVAQACTRWPKTELGPDPAGAGDLDGPKPT